MGYFGNFGHFRGFRVVLVVLEILRLFCSIKRFQGFFLDILCSWGNFGDFRSIFAIPVIPKGYFGDLTAHSSRFRGILFILEVFGLF